MPCKVEGMSMSFYVDIGMLKEDAEADNNTEETRTETFLLVTTKNF